MCGYGNRVPEGWHRISDQTILHVGPVIPHPVIWEPARPLIPDYEGKEADLAMLAEVAAKPEEMYGSY